jgi:hypothetical protein
VEVETQEDVKRMNNNPRKRCNEAIDCLLLWYFMMIQSNELIVDCCKFTDYSMSILSKYLTDTQKRLPILTAEHEYVTFRSGKE